MAHALVRKLSDLFYNEQTGCRQDLSSHLRASFNAPATRKIWIARFVGNRLNILFVNAASAYLYKDAIIDYFRNISLPTNDLQRSVFNTLASGTCNVAFRALGLVGKFVTGPWQRLVDRELSILELNTYYAEAKTVLAQWAENSTSVIAGDASTIFSGVDLKRDDTLTSLTSSCDTDAETAELFSKMCSKILEVMDRQLADQLPGGKFWDPSDHLQAQSRSCSSTNMSGERIFGRVDSTLKRAPNMTSEKVESRIMFSANKTTDWLSGKAAADRVRIIQQARSKGAALSVQERKNREQFMEMLCVRLQTKRAAVEERENKRRDVTEKLVDDVVRLGIWTADDVDNKLTGCRAKVAALKTQINLLIKVIGVKPDVKLALTKSTLPELKAHFLHLLQQPFSADQTLLHNMLLHPETLVGKDIRHTWKLDTQQVVYCGKVVQLVDEEFELHYAEETDSCYLTRGEVVTDIVRGDLVIVD